jgi:exosortase A-associated hydrolase 1
MKFEDQAVRFACHGSWLYGVLSLPLQAQTRGVLMLVGGAQYRAGSHRQFTLLARELASCGVPVLRFDYRGMGDSEGTPRTFEHVGDDIRCAIDHFFQTVPGMTDLVLWGLCDGASAALLYARSDRRVSGLALLNPWVRTESGLAKTYLRHYYVSRLLDTEFWRKILNRRFDYVAAMRSLLHLVRTAWAKGPQSQHGTDPLASDLPALQASLPNRMFDGYKHFTGKVLLILCGNDLTAKEFSDLAASSREWSQLVQSPRTLRRELPGADHTFSTRVERDQVGSWTKDWIQSW